MKSKKIIIIIIGLVILVLIYCLVVNNKHDVVSQNAPTFSTVGSTTAQKMITYVNTKYSYSLIHSENVTIFPTQEEERLPVEESSSIQISTPGESKINIIITAWNPYSYKTKDEFSIEHNRISSLDLESFAKTLHQNFIEDKNPNFPNKKISDLREFNFAGQKAYEATVTGYTDGYGSDVFKYIYVGDINHRLVLQYSLNGSSSKEIIDTFEFLK